ncbi:hypothetical protein [Shewanella algae]|uniref:hypothetical protein n=1 Tax=Shewanella algae TaxID=38313 RepID=UPI0031F49154
MNRKALRFDASNFNDDLLPKLEPMAAGDMEELRIQLGLSQAVMAKILNCTKDKVSSFNRPELKDRQLKGCDLIVANQLKSKGLAAYLGIANSEELQAIESLLSLVGRLQEENAKLRNGEQPKELDAFYVESVINQARKLQKKGRE